MNERLERILSKLDLTIETDRQGNHFVTFPGRQEELTPPRHYEDRLEWIQASFDMFFLKVRELDVLRKSGYIEPLSTL